MSFTTWFSTLVPIVMVGLFSAVAVAAPTSLSVSAGDFDRHDTPVRVELPEGAGRAPKMLTDDHGSKLPLQMIDERHGWFILPALAAHQSATFHISDGAPGVDVPAGVDVKRDGGKLNVVIHRHSAFTYQGEKTPLPAGFEPQYQRGGYIYPVLTPSGVNVSDDYPPNHKHHHGIWAPWTKTEFEGRHPDFWNMGDKTGTVEPVDFGGAFSGIVCGGFTAHHRFVDLTATPPKGALNETWQVLAFAAGATEKEPYHLFDLSITQTCATDSPLILEKYHYGGLGFRGAREWNGKDPHVFLTSEGKDRSNGNQTRGRWCWIGGKVAGKEAGISILCSPDDFRFPQPMRLNPDQPFFCYAPEQLGEFSIEPGKPFVQRYRFFVCDGPADPAEINRIWNDYAHPPEVALR